ncbi:hypothetical protein ALI144C_36615 [Actinosynnema sp. ALI-1.44]|uniref:MmcQ/YjbR family DNA-binding protein n=1 Tax=Actinosynnema sp. ALI-1.44 TaxID=1933779 RepID=UPI00097C4FF9|nr:MmcQ/YjbR family DNA-binding protein [Actinosynnema sp. ALI-1.44]ONI76199.1 hypothetical protein ALI144C_36615 [Actinosynnema sp. ALI-1.44]
MTPEELNDLAMTFPGTTEEPAFGPETNVYKVAGKVFAIMQPSLDVPQVTLKCEPGTALELRARFSGISEGYHVNKKHWITVLMDGSVPSDEMGDIVAHAYRRAALSLTKSVQGDLAKRGMPTDVFE